MLETSSFIFLLLLPLSFLAIILARCSSHDKMLQSILEMRTITSISPSSGHILMTPIYIRRPSIAEVRRDASEAVDTPLTHFGASYCQECFKWALFALYHHAMPSSSSADRCLGRPRQSTLRKDADYL